MRSFLRPLPVSALLLAILSAASAGAAIDILLDFDDDDDPYTVRTALPVGQTTATARFILDVGALPLPTEPLWLQVTEGCCDAPQWEGHYGTMVDIGSIAFDPAFIAVAEPGFPVCTYCCPWVLALTFNAGAPVAAGGRYFIGQATWQADCQVEAGCSPPTALVLSGWEIAGSGPMAFTCSVVPVQIGPWGAVKARWR